MNFMRLLPTLLLGPALVVGGLAMTGCAREQVPVRGTAVADVREPLTPAVRSRGEYPFTGSPNYRAWYDGASQVRAYRVAGWTRDGRIAGPLEIDQPPLAVGTIEPGGRFEIKLPGKVSVKNEGTLEHLISGLAMVDLPGCSPQTPLRVSREGVKVADVRLASNQGKGGAFYPLDNWRGYSSPTRFDTALAFFIYAPEPVRAESVWKCTQGSNDITYRVDLPLRRGWNMAEVSIRLVPEGKVSKIYMQLKRLEAPLNTWIMVLGRGPLEAP